MLNREKRGKFERKLWEIAGNEKSDGKLKANKLLNMKYWNKRKRSANGNVKYKSIFCYGMAADVSLILLIVNFRHFHFFLRSSRKFEEEREREREKRERKRRKKRRYILTVYGLMIDRSDENCKTINLKLSTYLSKFWNFDKYANY